MKKVFLSLLVLFIAGAAFAQQSSSDVAVFQSDVIDFGKIPQGVPVTATFTVKNVGKTPLIIESAQPNCGCTIGDYTKSPIKPGGTGTITATYNAQAMGYFTKPVAIKFAGFSDTRQVNIKGNVVDKSEIAATPAPAAKPAVAEQKVESKQKTTNGTTKKKHKAKVG